MDRKTAERILIAHACCYGGSIGCVDCPLMEEDGRCRPWTDEEIAEAVRTLRREGADG